MLDKLDEDALRSFDCVVLTTDHDQFDYEWIADNARLVFDTRNAFRNVDKPHVYRLGTPLRAGDSIAGCERVGDESPWCERKRSRSETTDER